MPQIAVFHSSKSQDLRDGVNDWFDQNYNMVEIIAVQYSTASESHPDDASELITIYSYCITYRNL